MAWLALAQSLQIEHELEDPDHGIGIDTAWRALSDSLTAASSSEPVANCWKSFADQIATEVDQGQGAQANSSSSWRQISDNVAAAASHADLADSVGYSPSEGGNAEVESNE